MNLIIPEFMDDDFHCVSIDSDNHLVRKHDSLVHSMVRLERKSIYNMTKNEAKLFNYIIAQVYSESMIHVDGYGELSLREVFFMKGLNEVELLKNLPKQRMYISFQYKNFLRSISSKSKNTENPKDICDTLSRLKLYIENKQNNDFLIQTLFPMLIYKKGVVYVEISALLYSMVTDLDTNYLSYDIKHILNLDSNYSIRIYEMLKNILKKNTSKSNKSGTIAKVKLDVIRKVLAVPSKYAFGDIKRIINSKRQDLFLNTDICFDEIDKTNMIKDGRKVVGIAFRIYYTKRKDK